MSVKESYQKLEKALEKLTGKSDLVPVTEYWNAVNVARALSGMVEAISTAEKEQRAISSEAYRLLGPQPTASIYPQLAKLAKEFGQKLATMSIQEAADHFFQSEQKISLIKHIRTLTGLGLWEAKMMADGIWAQKEKEKKDARNFVDMTCHGRCQNLTKGLLKDNTVTCTVCGQKERYSA